MKLILQKKRKELSFLYGNSHLIRSGILKLLASAGIRRTKIYSEFLLDHVSIYVCSFWYDLLFSKNNTTAYDDNT